MLQVRAAALTAYLEVARFVGLDGLRMLRDAGISPGDLHDPEHRLPAAPAVRLLERSAKRSGCESFGLLMAEARTFASVGPVTLLLERLANSREVALAIIAFQRHLNDIITFSLEEHRDTCIVGLDIAPECWGDQIVDNSVAMAYRAMTGASHNRWRPACVHLMRSEPKDPAPWRRFYSGPIEFGASFNGLSSSCAALRAPNPHADAEMARHARRLLKLLPLSREPDTVGDRVRRVVALLLPTGRATLEQVAGQLGLSPRSLQRHLDQEGHTFADLLDAVRRELVTAHLAIASRPITAIAPLLGYASPSSFTRWFAGAFGTSPQAWRAAQASLEAARGGPPPSWRR